MSQIVKNSDTEYKVVVTGMTDGDTVRLTVPEDTVRDAAGNGNEASTGDNNWALYDTTAPQSFAVNVDVEAPHTLQVPLLTFPTTDNGSGIVYYEVSADGREFQRTTDSTYTVDPALSGDDATLHTIVVRAYDRAGNMTEKVVKYPPSLTINAPTKLSNKPITDSTITIGGPSEIEIASVTVSGAGAENFTCDPLPRNVTFNCAIPPITETGTVTVVVTATSGVTVENSQAYTIDTVPPTVTINNADGQADVTNKSPIYFTAVFSEDVQETDMEADDIALSGSTTAKVVDIEHLDKRTYRVKVDGMQSGETVTAAVKANAARDLAGNESQASTSVKNDVLFDSARPTVTIALAPSQSSPTNAKTVQYIVTFSEPVTGFDDISKILVQGSNSATAAISAQGTNSYLITLSNLTDGDKVGIKINDDIAADAAGNKNHGAETAEADKVVIDYAAPVVAVSDDMLTNKTSPALSGTVDDKTAVVAVEINGARYIATNNGDGTWTLPEGTIQPALTEGNHSATIVATDGAGNVSESEILNINIDVTPPVLDVEAIGDDIENSPAVSGTVNDPQATIIVEVDGVEYEAKNNGDGTWELAAGEIQPGLTVGKHTINVRALDRAGNRSLIASQDVTILRADADAPTVKKEEWIGEASFIAGTYDAENSQNLAVEINGKMYSLGDDKELTANSGEWRLDISGLNLPIGVYDVRAWVMARDGSHIFDTTTDELAILKPIVPQPITPPAVQEVGKLLVPNTGVYAQVTVGWLVILASVAVLVGALWFLLIVAFRRRRAEQQA